MKKTALLFFMVGFILLFSCRKDKGSNPTETLPPETQEGKNTFGCYVNGNLWLPKNGVICLGCPQKLTGGYYPSYKSLAIYTFKKNKDWQSERINIIGNDITSTGIYNLGYDPDSLNTSYELLESDGSTSTRYVLIDPSNSQLNITKLDTINKIVSGKFSFTAIHGNSTISITNGVFDINYK